MATDFPTKDEDKKISLRNSNYPQFDYGFIAGVKENDPNIYNHFSIEDNKKPAKMVLHFLKTLTFNVL